MKKFIQKQSLKISALTTIAMLSGAADASAGNNFSKVAANVATSAASLPGLISGVAYMLGILLAVLGILKIKDHVENPGQTPLQHGVIRLVAGGGLFALPIVTESMFETIGDGTVSKVALVNKVKLGLQ